MPHEYVQYGCGLSCPDGWINFDASPRLRFERLPIVCQFLDTFDRGLFPKEVRYGDIVSGLPVPDGCAKAVYCSHVLEHIDRESVVKALKNTYRILRPGGTFRLVVPDLAWRAEHFLSAHLRSEPNAADEFMRLSHLGQETAATGIIRRLRGVFGNSNHLWMYDEALMTSLLERTGFVSIRRCHLGDAEDPVFGQVEEEGRFVDGGYDELALEALRPI
jgi:SAM-dependent methyltransferase